MPASTSAGLAAPAWTLTRASGLIVTVASRKAIEHRRGAASAASRGSLEASADSNALAVGGGERLPELRKRQDDPSRRTRQTVEGNAI